MKKQLLFMILFIIGIFFVLNIGEVNAVPLVSVMEVASECEEVIDAEVYDFLQQIFNVIKYAGPILCLAFSVIDFVVKANSPSGAS